MIHRRSPDRFVLALGLLACVVGASLLPVDAAAGEEEKRPKPKPPVAAAAPTEGALVKLYPLKYADVETVIMSIEPVAPDAHVTVNDRNNSLIVLASQSTHEQVKELLAKLDAPPDRDAGLQVKVFQVVHADAEAMAEVVLDLLRDDRMNISVDRRTNSVLATGPEGILEVIEALLLRLDEEEGREKDRKPSATHYVRVVWFTDGPAGEKTVEIDNQMLMIQAEMAKIGVKGIHPVAQVMVGTTSGGDFELDCTLTLADGPVELKVSGKLDVEEDTPRVTIELAAGRMEALDARGQSFQHVQLADLATEIVAPFDHFVVLGVAPLEKMTSIFAVQVRQGM